MAKRGRKPKQNVVREPNGRASRAKANQLENVEPILVRMRKFGLTESQARDQKAATFIGRLQLCGAVSEGQYDAAVEYLRLYEAYKRAISAPDGLKASEGHTNGASSEAHAKWCQQTRKLYDAVKLAITAAQCRIENRGRNLFAAVDYIISRDEQHWHMVEDCRVALDALAKHFGVVR